jgi:maleylpyruvate isomerase
VTADPLVLSAEVDRATARLLGSARGLDPAAVTGPSLLPGWTRGHVLTHIARNADGCTNLLTWARTGVETPQYPSVANRNAEIEDGAGRPLAEHLADLATSARRFADAVELMPAPAWTETVRWLAGNRTPAATIVWSRLREIEVHHVDLDAGYGPADWPDAFTHRLLHEIAAGFAAEPAPDAGALAARLHATDLGHELVIGPAAGAPTINGPGYALAAWLTGRSDGAGLTVTPAGPLPAVPVWK